MSEKDHLNHKPSPVGVAAIEAVKRAIINLDAVIEDNVPPGREKSLALTKLEEARMWAVKGIVVEHSTGTDPIPADKPAESYLSHVDGAGPVS